DAADGRLRQDLGDLEYGHLADHAVEHTAVGVLDLVDDTADVEALTNLHASGLTAIDVDDLTLQPDDLTGWRGRHRGLQPAGLLADSRNDLLDGGSERLLCGSLVERPLGPRAAERAAAHALVALPFG